MHCCQCGTEVKEDETKCEHCGTKVGKGRRYCPICGTKFENSPTCKKCGFSFTCGFPFTPASVQNDTLLGKEQKPSYPEAETPQKAEAPEPTVPPEETEPPALQEPPKPANTGEDLPIASMSPLMQQVIEKEVSRQKEGYPSSISAEELLGEGSADPSDRYLEKFKNDQRDREQRRINERKREETEENRKREQQAKRMGESEKPKKGFFGFKDKEKAEKGKGNTEEDKPELPNDKTSPAPVQEPETTPPASVQEKAETLPEPEETENTEPSRPVKEETEKPLPLNPNPNQRPAKRKNEKIAQGEALAGFILSLLAAIGVFIKPEFQALLIPSAVCAVSGLSFSLAGKKGGYLSVAGLLLSIVAIVCLASPFIISKLNLGVI